MTVRRLGTRTGRITSLGFAAAVVALAGIAPQTSVSASAVTPATDAEACVAPFPADQLVADQALTGLTVTRGTDPQPFGGTYLDTLVDGIAPGVDMIVADLDSPAIAANGIWQGMSGSPVYDPETGRLIGAVSYALSMGPTTIAGITPADEMLSLLTSPTAESAVMPAQVTVTRSLQAALVDSGDATRAQASAGLRRLPVPLAVSGLDQRRFDQLDGLLGDGGPVTRAAGGTGPSSEEIAVEAGGNLAASLSHGAVTMAALGTATAVCGDQVVGFGHPLQYAGDTTYSLHGARAVTIQPDPVMSAYKLANLGAPVGTVTEDRLAGLHGILGPVPASLQVSSTATYRGRTAHGTTQVSVAEMLSDIGLATMASVNDRALDHFGRGGAVASWTIEGLRRNGVPFTITSGDRYADGYDVAGAPLTDLAHQLYSLTDNATERVTITSVTTTTDFTDDASSRRLGRTYSKVRGAWRPITMRRPLLVKAGSTNRVRIELVSRDHDSRFVQVAVRVPAGAADKTGKLVLTGGAAGEDDFFFGDEEMFFFDVFGGRAPSTIPQLIKSFDTEQKNDEVRSALRVRGSSATTTTLDLHEVVSGRVVLPVVVSR